MDTPQVIYNGTCPICTREIAIYRARQEKSDLPMGFVDLAEADLASVGLDADSAARRLHIVHRGEVISGVDAFVMLWRGTPGFGWAARIAGLPGVRQLTAVVYDYVLAPTLYAMHRRRQRRAGLRP